MMGWKIQGRGWGKGNHVTGEMLRLGSGNVDGIDAMGIMGVGPQNAAVKIQGADGS